MQRRTPTESSGSSPSRKTTQRSPLREGDRGSPIRSSPSSYTIKDPGVRTSEKDTSKMFNQRVSDQRVPFMNFDERFARGEKNISRSPEKDTSGPLDPVRGTGEGLVYRDSERRSSHREVANSSQLREYDRSPHRDINRAGQRSPGRERPEPSVPGVSYRDTSPNPSNRDIARHSPYKVKSQDGERRRDARSPERKSYKSEDRATKDGGESSETQRRLSTEKVRIIGGRTKTFLVFCEEGESERESGLYHSPDSIRVRKVFKKISFIFHLKSIAMQSKSRDIHEDRVDSKGVFQNKLQC